MTYCTKCGIEIPGESSFCPSCGQKQAKEYMTSKRRSRWWFLLPIFFSVIGGLIAYFVLKEDDPKLAKNCLILGLVMIAVGMATSIGLTFAMIPIMMSQSNPAYSEFCWMYPDSIQCMNI